MPAILTSVVGFRRPNGNAGAMPGRRASLFPQNRRSPHPARQYNLCEAERGICWIGWRKWRIGLAGRGGQPWFAMIAESTPDGGVPFGDNQVQIRSCRVGPCQGERDTPAADFPVSGQFCVSKFQRRSLA